MGEGFNNSEGEKFLEAAGEAIFDLHIESGMLILAKISKIDPQFGKELEEAFEEYTKTGYEILREKEDVGLADIKKRIPENKWIKFVENNLVPSLREIKENQAIDIVPGEREEDLRREIIERAQKKIKGQDKQ